MFKCTPRWTIIIPRVPGTTVLRDRSVIGSTALRDVCMYVRSAYTFVVFENLSFTAMKIENDNTRNCLGVI